MERREEGRGGGSPQRHKRGPWVSGSAVEGRGRRRSSTADAEGGEADPVLRWLPAPEAGTRRRGRPPRTFWTRRRRSGPPVAAATTEKAAGELGWGRERRGEGATRERESGRERGGMEEDQGEWMRGSALSPH